MALLLLPRLRLFECFFLLIKLSGLCGQLVFLGEDVLVQLHELVVLGLLERRGVVAANAAVLSWRKSTVGEERTKLLVAD